MAGVNILAFLPKIPLLFWTCLGKVWRKNRIFVLNFVIFVLSFGIFVLNFGVFVLNFGTFVLNFGIFTLSPAGKVLLFFPEYLPLVSEGGISSRIKKPLRILTLLSRLRQNVIAF